MLWPFYLGLHQKCWSRYAVLLNPLTLHISFGGMGLMYLQARVLGPYLSKYSLKLAGFLKGEVK